MSAEVLVPVSDLEDCLAPFSSENPAGEPLRYEGTYDRIREARRADDPALPRDIWERELEAADWTEVEELCVEALRERSKDLQIGAWLLEAWLKQRGFRGVADGMELLLGLSRTFWDTAYPELRDDDPERRAAPFLWINEKLTDALAFVELARSQEEERPPLTWGDVKRARWTESARARLRARGQSEDEEKEIPGLSMAEVREFVSVADPEELRRGVREVRAAVEATRALELFLDGRMEEDAPSLVRFRGELEEVRDWAARHVDALPDPAAEAESDSATSEDGGEPDASDTDDQVGTPEGVQPSDREEDAVRSSESEPIRTRAEAYERLLEAAEFLQRVEPHSPTPYLVRRAVAWGEMSLSELLKEFAEDGLDLHALFTLLGLDDTGPSGDPEGEEEFY